MRRGSLQIGLALLACGSGCGVAPAAIIGGSFVATGNDTTPRFFHRAGLLPNGLVIVTGGMRLQISPASLISLNAISFYNPATGTFSNSFAPTGGGAPVTPVLATARSSHTQTTLLDGRVLVTGGHTGASGTSPGTSVNSVEIFHPQTGLVSAGPSMNSARVNHTATLLPDGRVVVTGFSTWQVFDPAGNAWSAEFALQRGRAEHAAVLLPDHAGPGGHRVLLIGGAGSGPDTLELLDPFGMTSSLRSATLVVGVDDLAAGRLDDGRVLIVGGQNPGTGQTVNRTYLYDPLADAMVEIAPPPNRTDGMADHELVSMGRFALIFGGEQEVGGTDTELSYAAFFDRATGQWTQLPNMTQARDDAAAVALPDGRVLLIGGAVGFFGVPLPTATAELFVPNTVLLGDLNGDGQLSAADVPGMVATLVSPAGATPRDLCAADVDENGRVDGDDVQPFVALLLP